MDLFETAARAAGPIDAWRVIVLEGDNRITHKDFADLAEAKGYANDCASESDDAAPIAVVFDRNIARVHKGASFTD